jgi:hypothetical protein
MATEIKPKEAGAVGYPMTMALLAGSELLGALTSDVPDRRRIEHYWGNYLKLVNEKYGDLGAIAKELFRNGIAHSYLSRPGVLVIRGRPELHLQLSSQGLIVDCITLYEDFRQSYEIHARSAILEHRAAAQRRLNKLTEHDHLKIGLLERLPAERWSVSDAVVPSTFVGIDHATPLLLRHLSQPADQAQG